MSDPLWLSQAELLQLMELSVHSFVETSWGWFLFYSVLELNS